MKLISLVKLILRRIPGYQRRVTMRKTRSTLAAKARLLASAKRRRIFNQDLQQPEHVYSQGVQEVLRFYDEELAKLQAELVEASSGARGLTEVAS